MPEYPEVTVVTNSLKAQILNKKITDFKTLNPKFLKNISPEEFKANILNKTITKVINIGKFIEITLSDQSRIISHLRMSGKYYIYPIKMLDFAYSQMHNYVFFILDEQFIICYNDARMFGGFDFIPSDDQRDLSQIKKLANLPIDVDVEQLFNKLKRKNISIKSVLLDQSLVLGIGNIYADESLWASQIHPMQKCNTLTKQQLELLLSNAQRIMDQSILQGGSSVHTYQSVNDTKGTYQNELKVYGRANNLCFRCKIANLVKVRLDYKPNGRGTTFCPICQEIKN